MLAIHINNVVLIYDLGLPNLLEFLWFFLKILNLHMIQIISKVSNHF